MQKILLKIQSFNFYHYKQQLGHPDIFERIKQKLAQKNTEQGKIIFTEDTK